MGSPARAINLARPQGRLRAAADVAREWVVLHPVLTAALVAVAARVLVASTVFVRSGGHLFLDDETYDFIARSKATNSPSWDSGTQKLYESMATYLVPVTWLYRAAWPSAIFGQLVAAAFGVATVMCVAWLVRWRLSPAWAAGAGLVAGLFPSQVLWSSLMLKDAAVWAVLAGLGVVLYRQPRRAPVPVAVWLGSIGILLFLLGHLRHHTLVVACWSVVLVALVERGRDRWVSTGAVVVALAVPLVVGIGVGGIDRVRDSGSLSERRYLNSLGANSRLVDVTTTTVAPAEPVPAEPSAPAGPGGPASSVPSTPSTSTTAPPTTVPPEDDGFDDAIGADVRHLPTGLGAMLVRPAPWERQTSTGAGLARVENVLWYPLLALALVGAVLCLRRRTTLYLVFILGGVATMYALSEGNLGTAYRHRGEFVWATFVLAAIAGEWLLDRRRSARA